MEARKMETQLPEIAGVRCLATFDPIPGTATMKYSLTLTGQIPAGRIGTLVAYWQWMLFQVRSLNGKR
jgi:hypothetical protein